MALYLKEGSEESNIRGLVETCAHNDDITPLVKLVFEAQALADSPPSIAADGQTMVSIICGALRAVADDQDTAIDDVCHSNATAIAHTVAELEHMHRKVEEVKSAMLGANSGMQEVGSCLVSNEQHVNQLTEVQDNLQQAAAAVQAAQGVLEQCLLAGELIGQHQLYPALCMLDKIRRKQLAALLTILPSNKHGTGKGASGGAAGVATAAAGKRLTGRELEHLQTLHVFFSSLVDDMSANVQRLALKGFNQWLVFMRGCARGVGMSAIQAAAVERSLEDNLAAERKALLAALSVPGGKTVREIAAELGRVQFRQDLLKAAADEAASQAASKASGSSGGSTAGSAGGSSAAETRSGGGGNFSANSQSLRDILKRPSQKGKLPRQLAAAAAASAACAEQPASAELPELDELHPGEPERSIRDLITFRSDAINKDRLRHQQQQREQQQLLQKDLQQQSNDPSHAVKSLLQLDMSGLYTAVHVAKSLGQLDSFRAHYLDQRRLQLTADLQAPSNFLQTYQAYLAQVTGFFVLESFVQRVTEDLMGPGEAAQLWGVALRSLKVSLEAAFEHHLSSAPQMLMVKDFLVLVCVALERTGHPVVAVTEILQSTCGRYHELLSIALQEQLNAVVESDVLSELEVRTKEQHQQLVAEFDLPWHLEEAPEEKGRGSSSKAWQGPARKPPQLAPGGVPLLPYVAPFTACVPQLLGLVRKFVIDSLAYLRDMYSPWELLPAVFHQRDRMLSKVLVEVLSAKARTVGSQELLRECMKCAANAWALGRALDGLDDWTISQARPDSGQPVVALREGPISSPHSVQGQAGDPAAAASKLSRARNRKAVLASGALTNTVQTALKALQESSERDVLRALASRIEQLLESSRKGDWTPSEPLPSSPSPWVNALLSYLQEIFDLGIKLLPRSSVVNLLRMALRATATAAMRAFGPEGVKAFNMYAVEKTAHNLLTVERFASRWGVTTSEEELAEPSQICKLLLGGKVDGFVSSAEIRHQCYPALQPTVVIQALEKFKEVPQQSKKKPNWLTKKAADAAVKQLRMQAMASPSGTRLHEAA